MDIDNALAHVVPYLYVIMIPDRSLAAVGRTMETAKT